MLAASFVAALGCASLVLGGRGFAREPRGSFDPLNAFAGYLQLMRMQAARVLYLSVVVVTVGPVGVSVKVHCLAPRCRCHMAKIKTGCTMTSAAPPNIKARS